MNTWTSSKDWLHLVGACVLTADIHCGSIGDRKNSVYAWTLKVWERKGRVARAKHSGEKGPPVTMGGPFSLQSPRLFWARIMLKWANKYLWIERIQSWSVYGDSNSFSMVVLGKKMDCQKVAPFLRNPPTFKKRTQHFWDSKVSGAFPGGLSAKVFPKMSSTIFKKANPEIFIKILQFW